MASWVEALQLHISKGAAAMDALDLALADLHLPGPRLRRLVSRIEGLISQAAEELG